MAFLKPPDIENKTPNQLMLHLLEFYKQIPFKEGNEHKGNWDELFKDQQLFFQIELFEKQLDIFQRKREILVNNWKVTPLKKYQNFLSELIEILERWLSLSLNYGIEWIWKEIKDSVKDINLGYLQLFYTINEEQHPLPGHFLWEDKKIFFKDKNHLNSPAKKQVFEDYSYRILNCLLHIQRNVKEKDWKQWIATQQHPPHIGLMYGFSQAFELVKKKLNQLPQRHLDFYYQSVLQQQKKKAKPDFTYIFIQLKEGVLQYELPNNTLFKAGTNPDGTPIEFSNYQAVTFSGAKITHLSTLLVHASPQNHPLETAKGVSGIYYENIPLKERNHFNNPKPWKLFGEPTEKNLSLIGWAIASPLFFTTSGERTYQLNFHFTEESCQKARQLLQKMAEKSSYSLAQLYHYFFHENFEVRITTLSGWKSVSYEFNANDFLAKKSNSIQLSFHLSAKEEAWIPFNKKVHPSAYDEKHPLIEIVPKNATSYYPYSFLKQLVWKKCDVEVEVKNSTSTQLYNKHGLIDQNAPFPLLGVNPTANDEFYIGNVEWQHKNLQRLAIEIRWDQLPYPNFETYYQEYETGNFKDEEFKVVTPDEKPPQPHQIFSLNDEGKLKTSTSWENIVINKKMPAIPSSSLLNLKENPDAFIQFKLVSPNYGFGQGIYRNEMINFSKKQIQLSKKKRPVVPPNPPFVPYAKKVIINYKSSNTIDLRTISKEENSVPFSIYHLHPLGIYPAFKNNHISSNRMVPNLKNRGYMYMGVQQLIPGQALSLFFKLKKSFANINNVNNTFLIEFLDGDNWKVLDKGKILKSTISEGTSSGMLSFKTPRSLSSHHPFFSDENYWFRFSVHQKFISSISNCECIVTNPVTVSRHQIENYNSYQHIPAQSISGAKETIKEIDKIIQPMPSIGGKNTEKKQEFYERVAQRLQHKNRMVRINDYKNLLYENFEDIKWVKVVTPSASKKVKAGEVHLVMIPRFKSFHEMSELSFNGTRIKQIKNFIQAKTFPGVDIKVFSPLAETIKVYANLVINAQHSIPSLEEINEIINEEIAPWASEEGFSNGKKSPDSSFNILKLTSKLKKLPFVKEVKNCGAIKLSYNRGKYNYTDTAEGQEILEPSSYKNILIPSEDHKISFYKEDGSDEILGNAIGGMVVGSDLIIKKDNPKEILTTANKEENGNYHLVKINKKNNYGND